MKYSESRLGRIFIVRLEDGEILHKIIEKFAEDKNIKSAFVAMLGGVDKGSTLVVGPKKGRSKPIKPVERILDEVHEASAVGTIFPDEKNNPVLHMHAACGRGGKTITGCVRSGVNIWHVGEVVIFELTGTESCRKKDPSTGFELLEP